MLNINTYTSKKLDYLEGGKKLYIISVLVAISGFLYLALYHIIKFQFYLPSYPCPFRTTLHLYCPGCGGTRATKALLDFNFIKSFICNPFVLYMVIIFLYYFVGSTLALLSKFKIVIFHFRFWMLYSGLALFFINCIIVNILAVHYGIDYLGDISYYWH